MTSSSFPPRKFDDPVWIIRINATNVLDSFFAISLYALKEPEMDFLRTVPRNLKELDDVSTELAMWLYDFIESLLQKDPSLSILDQWEAKEGGFQSRSEVIYMEFPGNSEMFSDLLSVYVKEHENKNKRKANEKEEDEKEPKKQKDSLKQALIDELKEEGMILVSRAVLKQTLIDVIKEEGEVFINDATEEILKDMNYNEEEEEKEQLKEAISVGIVTNEEH